MQFIKFVFVLSHLHRYAFLIFISTWFDCAQYAHIAWWMMSFAMIESAFVTGFRAESGQLLITN